MGTALKGQISGTTTVNGGTLDISLGASTHPDGIALAADTTLSYALDERRQLSTQTLSGVISGEGKLTKGGRSGLFLSNDNTYTGVTTISDGALILLSAEALPGSIGTTGGLSPLTFNGGVLGLGAGDFTRSLAAAGTPTGATFSNKLITSGGITGSLDLADLSGTIGAVTGTLQITGNDLELVVGTGGASPYQIWAGDAAFTADANGDGVANGLAWLLGAATPAANATGLLPKPTGDAGKLVLGFRCLASAGRGTALLKVQFSNDLGQTDLWASHEAVVPDANGTVGGVIFTVTPDAAPAFVNVLAEIPASAAAADGKLFGRLAAQE